MTEPRPGVLLDRDGTIIVDSGYLGDPDGVVLEAGAIEGLQALAAAGLPLAVLTNQSGIARGLYDRAAALAVNARVGEHLAEAGVSVAGWYICPHGPEDACDCRKPSVGMALAAARDLRLDLRRSWVIGDKRSDLELALAVGAMGILVKTGEGAQYRRWATDHGIPVCASIADAARLILRPAGAGAHATTASG